MLSILFVGAFGLACEGDITAAIEAHVGQRINLGHGKCVLSRPAKISAPTTIEGEGRAHTAIEAPFGGFLASAALSLEGVRLWRADRPTFEAVYGIDATAPPVLEHVELAGFTTGVQIYASVDDFGTNANAWRLYDVRVAGAGHAGVFVRGRDANAGMALGVRVNGACEHASLFPALGPCAGIVDRSFLGNTWIAPLVASSRERIDGALVPYPAYLLSGDSQHSVLIGPYRERDQGAPEFDQATVSIGGLSNDWKGPGLRIDGPVFNSLVVRNTKDPANVVEVRMGDIAASGTFLEFRAKGIDDARPLRLKADPKTRQYKFDIANQIAPLKIGQDGRTVILP